MYTYFQCRFGRKIYFQVHQGQEKTSVSLMEQDWIIHVLHYYFLFRRLPVRYSGEGGWYLALNLDMDV